MPSTAFEAMCQEFRVLVQDKVSPYTHVMQTGGKYCFSEDEILQVPAVVKKQTLPCIDRSQFIRQYCERFQESPTVSEFAYAALCWWWERRKQPSEGVSLISKRTDPLFFMYFDLDMKFAGWDVSLWIQQQRTVATIVHTTVTFYFDRPLEMTVAVTDTPRIVSTSIHKVGMHMYFPTLVVNFEEALVLLHAVTVRVRDVLGERNLPKGENSWSDVFDASVYRNGLRDCATFKTNPCEKCQSRNNRDFDVDSLYTPRFLVSNDELTDITRELSVARGYVFGEFDLTLHRLARVRCSAKEAVQFRGNMKICSATSIGYIPSNPDELEVTRSRKSREETLQYPIDLGAQRKFRNFVLLYFCPEDLRRIEACIRENFNEARYFAVQIRSIYAFFWRDKDHSVDVLGKPCRFSKIKITLKGEGSRYCFNKGDHHSSNTAYFEIPVRNSSLVPRIEQRCWSPHSYKCQGVVRVCERFRSGQIKMFGQLSKSVIALLFHNTQAQPEISRSP